jgi:hypothetical protein
MDSDRPSKANLVASYGEFSGKDILPPKDVMFTIIPSPCFLIIGITACITLTAKKSWSQTEPIFLLMMFPLRLP